MSEKVLEPKWRLWMTRAVAVFFIAYEAVKQILETINP